MSDVTASGPNDCIRERIPWMDDPEEMASKAAITLSRPDRRVNDSGDAAMDYGSGRVFLWSSTQYSTGDVIKRFFYPAYSHGAPQAIHFRVIRAVSYQEVTEMFSASEHAPLMRSHGYWLEVHGD